MNKKQVYVASRASVPERSAMWRALRDQQGWPIISTWIDEAGEGETGDFMELWRRIQHEIDRSCGLIVYAEATDFPLKGALVEVGIALGMGKPVIVVLKDVTLDGRTARPVGSWIQHPQVSIQSTLDAALRLLMSLVGSCDHQWSRDEPGDDDCCMKCGISFTRYTFMECP